jgi:hypothetical protein
VGPSGLDGSLVVPQVIFESGFCAPEGDETIELHYSLRRLLIEELHRRLQPDGGYAGGAPRHRDLPTGASWMRRSRRRAPARPSATVGEAGLLGVSVHAHP